MTAIPEELPPYTEWHQFPDGSESLVLQGVVHELTVMPALSEHQPLMIEIQKGGVLTTALLDREQITVLRRFLASYDETSPEFRENG